MNLMDTIELNPTLDPTHLPILDLVKMYEKMDEDNNSRSFLVGILCCVTLKSMLVNFSETNKIIEKIENKNIKQTLLGVQHARMALSTF